MALTERPTESIRGVVLAGGDSTRFGSDDKALARIGSERILNRIVRVLEQATHREPAIAVRTRQQQATYSKTVSDTNVQFVFDDPEHDGPLAGLLGAAATLSTRWLFCCGCDMPLIEPPAVRWLIDQIPQQTTDQQQVDAIALEYPTGVVEPLHTVYRRKSVAELQRTLPRTAGPRLLLSELDTVSVSIADTPDRVPLEPSTTNINTREELAAIQTELSRS